MTGRQKQSMGETAACGSEFNTGHMAVEHIMEHRTTLCYMGVPVLDHSFLFGNNKSVVNSSTHPDSRLNKRYNLLSFHRVCEAIASGMIWFFHIPGEINPADILSKHWSYAAVWQQLRTILFAKGSQLMDE